MKIIVFLSLGRYHEKRIFSVIKASKILYKMAEKSLIIAGRG